MAFERNEEIRSLGEKRVRSRDRATRGRKSRNGETKGDEGNAVNLSSVVFRVLIDFRLSTRPIYINYPASVRSSCSRANMYLYERIDQTRRERLTRRIKKGRNVLSDFAQGGERSGFDLRGHSVSSARPPPVSCSLVTSVTRAIDNCAR